MDIHTKSPQDHTVTLLIEPKHSCYGLRPTSFARLFPHLGRGAIDVYVWRLGTMTLPMSLECW